SSIVHFLLLEKSRFLFVSGPAFPCTPKHRQPEKIMPHRVTDCLQKYYRGIPRHKKTSFFCSVINRSLFYFDCLFKHSFKQEVYFLLSYNSINNTLYFITT